MSGTRACFRARRVPRPGVRAATRLGHRQRLTATGLSTVAAGGGGSAMCVSMCVLALLNSVVAGLAATETR